MSDLPAGWTETRFEAISDVRLGKMLDKVKNKGEATPYLRNVNVRWGDIDTSDVLEMRMSALEREAFSIRDGDILVCEGGEPGRAAVWRGGDTKLTFQKALMRLRPYDEVQPDYLARYLRHASWAGLLEGHVTGTTIKHLPQNVLRRLEAPLPPLAEQRRIVAKLDALTARTARARADLDRVPALVARGKQRLLDNAFQQGRLVTIEQIADRVTKGESPKWQGFSYITQGILFIRSQNVGWGKIVLDERVHLDASFNIKREKSIIQTGDILLNIVGASIGRPAVATEAIAGANCNQAVSIIRLRERDPVDQEYVCWWLQSPQAQAKMVEGAVDFARANFSLANVRAMQLPWPKKEQRDTIVRSLSLAFREFDRVLAETAAACRLLDRLDMAILARAFRGELVPQDPADEPASVLLDRIRAELAASPAKARRGRKPRAA